MRNFCRRHWSKFKSGCIFSSTIQVRVYILWYLQCWHLCNMKHQACINWLWLWISAYIKGLVWGRPADHGSMTRITTVMMNNIERNVRSDFRKCCILPVWWAKKEGIHQQGLYCVRVSILNTNTNIVIPHRQSFSYVPISNSRLLFSWSVSNVIVSDRNLNLNDFLRVSFLITLDTTCGSIPWTIRPFQRQNLLDRRESTIKTISWVSSAFFEGRTPKCFSIAA